MHRVCADHEFDVCTSAFRHLALGQQKHKLCIPAFVTVSNPAGIACNGLMKLVGLTGGIACGKSLCSAELQAAVPVIDCDLIAHAVMNKVGTRSLLFAFVF